MKEYGIQWKSNITGTSGIGTKRFQKDEAELLAAELNESYPNFRHEALIPEPAENPGVAAAPQEIPSI